MTTEQIRSYLEFYRDLGIDFIYKQAIVDAPAAVVLTGP